MTKETQEIQENVWKIINELSKSQKEYAITQEELKKSQIETSKLIKEIGKQIGGIGNKFGSFTEGLAHPSVTKVLRQKFKVENVMNNFKNSSKGLEIDVLGYSNSDVNEVYIVEIKSQLKDEHIEQLLKTMKKFRDVFPEHKNKKIYGILATVTSNDELKERLNKLGIYHATSGENLFKIDSPKHFKPKAY